MTEETHPLDESTTPFLEEAVDVAVEPSANNLKTEIQQLREEMRQLRAALTGGTTNE